MTQTQTIPLRSDIALEDTWDATSVFPTDAAWEAAMAEVAEQLPTLERFHGHLGDSAALLAEWLQTMEELTSAIGKIFVYAALHSEVDTADQAGMAKRERALGIYSRTLGAMAFAEPEIIAIGPDRVQVWTNEEPRLAPYAHYFDQIQRRQAHVRSAEVEEVLSQVFDPFYTATMVHSTLVDADVQFKPARSSSGQELELGQGTISALLTDPDREVRRTAWQNYADGHIALKNGLATALSAGIKQDVFMARVRRYQSSLDAAMSENFIPEAVFRNLIDTFQRNLPTWHRYWNLRRRVLGYDQLHVYDIKAPLTTHSPIVPFQQAIDDIVAGMQPLGDEYVQIMRRGLVEQRWVDKYPNKGKRMGAFSSGVKGTHPFILMSYNNDLFSMSTLAHELGHSLHSYFTWQNQPIVYARYSMFVAETASNFNQALVRAHLLREHSDRDFQIALIEEAMSNFHRYFFIMPTLARFELDIHERVERGAALTADSLTTLMTDLFREGYGADVVIDAERVGSTWMQFSTHLYSNFYVYQYATGISAAHALAEGVLNGTPDAAENYLTFLKAGSSLYPLDALKLAGVDMTSPEPVEQTFAVLARMVDRLAELTQQ